MGRLFRRTSAKVPCNREWLVEIEPGSWLVQHAPSATEARVAAFRLAPLGKGPWTVRTREEHEAALRGAGQVS